MKKNLFLLILVLGILSLSSCSERYYANLYSQNSQMQTYYYQQPYRTILTTASYSPARTVVVRTPLQSANNGFYFGLGQGIGTVLGSYLVYHYSYPIRTPYQWFDGSSPYPRIVY